MNFLFVCGGTAGHINPAVAVAGELRRIMPDAKILFVGAGRDMENKLVPNAGYELKNIKMSGLKRGFSPDKLAYNMKTVKNLATAGGEAEKILTAFQPNAVIGTGGYICYPVLKRAARMGIPTLIHEANAVPGLTTKLLSAIVDKTLVSFPGLENLYRRPDRVVFTGTPIRGGFAGAPPESAERSDGKPLVVSFWGSLGAERMNEAMAEFIKLNADSGRFDHIHATGSSGGRGMREMQSQLKILGVPDRLPQGIEIREYIDDMPSVMAAASLVLCRAGASTIAELTAMGKPAVLVPSPYVTNNHQEENAKQLQKAGGADMLLEKDCTGEKLYDTVSQILDDSERLSKMSEAQKILSAPDATKKIVDLIITACESS